MAFTDIDDASAHFQCKIYSGTGSSQSITFDGLNNMKPDMWWQVNRDLARGIYVADSTRGVTKYLTTFTDNSEATVSTYVTSFDTNGFTLGNGDTAVNNSGQSFITWNWKANGGTTSSNTDGSITSTVQANTDAGFSIVTYTGNSTAGATIGHGLGAVPKVVLVKRTNSNNRNWAMYHEELGPNVYLKLGADHDDAQIDDVAYWNDTSPTSSVFTVGTGTNSRVNAGTLVAYCFAEKQGFSKFGKYVGTGSSVNSYAFGPRIHTGFKPNFVLIKAYDSVGNWIIFDNARSPVNLADDYQYANTAATDGTSTTQGIDFLSNGFKIRNTYQDAGTGGDGYIYMAFAKNPFVSSSNAVSPAGAV